MSKRRSNKKITIKDVAEHAKASMSTVSMVVNNKGYVSDGKKKEIMRSIEELGYVPTQSAKNLASNKTHNIGFILRESHFTLSEPFYTRIFLGTEFESRNHNYYVLLATVPDEYNPAKDTPRLLKEHNVDGLIIAGKVSPGLLKQVEDAHIPFVLVDFKYKSYPSITVNNFDASIEAVRYLLKQGYEEVGFLGADTSHPSIQARMEGYQMAMMKTGVKDIDQYVFVSEEDAPTLQTGMKLAEKMMKSPHVPRAVFCANDALALGVLKYAEQNNISIPDELAVMGFDDVDGAKYSSPKLSTVRVYKEQMGELALRHLIQQLDKETNGDAKYERGNHMFKTPTELILRESS